MLRDITLGQYYNGDSIIHRLDPRTKIFFTFAYLIMLFMVDNFKGIVFMTAVVTGVIIISKVPFRYIFKGLKAIIYIIIITVFFKLFFSTSGNVVWQWKFLKITDEGAKEAVFIAVRFVLIVIGTSVMTLTTTPNSLTAGLEKSLRFLSYIKVPVHEIALMMSIALRFIPVLMEETNKIMKAQTARGADFESGGIMRKAKAMVPIIVPLFVSAFRKANDLATAMDARCYHGGNERTKLHPLHYMKADGVAYVLVAVMVGCCVFVL